ncbi:DUF6153 family protein [Microbacterium sp. NPDC056736]|uniref:DUF6153 family protein n=1 Tax=Microbacterium sp. NPDC056736 TaxID=3345932 RepID=UPI003671B4FA
MIIGLLGMHSLTSGHSGSVAASSMSMAAEHGHVAISHSPVTAEPACADCGSGGAHEAMIIACVLGLLAAIVLIARSTPSVVRSRGRTSVPAMPYPLIDAPTRPPSLMELSISRR